MQDDRDPPTAAPMPPPPTPARPAGLRPRRAVAWTLGIVVLLPLLLALAAAAAAAWALRTPGGTAWLLQRLPGVSVTAPSGALWGDFRAERVVVTWAAAARTANADGTPPADNRVQIDDLAWDRPALRWPVEGAPLAALRLDRLAASRVVLSLTSDPQAAPTGAPATLRVPVTLDIDQLQIGELQPAPDQRVRDLRASVHVGGAGGARHRLDALQLGYDRWQLNGSVQLGADAPFETQARVALQSAAPQAPPPPTPAAADDPLTRYRIELDAQGPLAALQTEARVRARAADAATPPVLTARTELRPFAAWPIGRLDARAQGLDLAALAPGLPTTALRGQVALDSAGLDRPAEATVDLVNEAAGRWDRGRLPIKRVDATLQGQPDRQDALAVPRLQLRLGSADEPDTADGGALDGSLRWDGDRATAELQWRDLVPSRLDARAPAGQLSGPLRLQLDGLQAAGVVPSPAAPRPPGAALALEALQAQLEGRLDGQLPVAGKRQALRLALNGRGNGAAVETLSLDLQSGPSRLRWDGHARRESAERWRVQGDARIERLDPATWWTPATAPPAWRQGQRVNGRVRVDVSLPTAAPATAAGWMAALRGDAQADLSDSVLVGVPVAGAVTVRGDGQRASGSLQAQVAGSAVSGDGQLGLARGGPEDQGQLNLASLDLARLAPWFAWAGWDGAQGRVAGSARLRGRWPAVSTQGELQADDVRAGPQRLERGRLRWDLAMQDAQAPLSLQGQLDGLVAGSARVERIDLDLQGRWADHRLTLVADAPLEPPAWLDALTAAPTAAGAAPPPVTAGPARGTRAQLALRGSLTPGAAGALPRRWQGRIDSARVGRREDGSTAWLTLDPMPVDVQFDASGRPASLTAAPGRLQSPAGALRWSALQWDAAGAGALTLDARLEPLQLAPLLARLQPGFGWSGDLVADGHVRVQQRAGWDVDVEFARRSGDLRVSEGNGELALGLTEARLALQARDGRWQLTQAITGQTIGSLTGAVTARTRAATELPDAQTPLEGSLELRVANLATWAAWVPAGWRLGGTARASARIGGRMGAPEITGRLDGQDLAVRNLLEGVDLRHGVLAVALEGQRARIERFTMQAGEGRLDIAGEARFGEQPGVNLDIRADRMQILGRVDRRILVSGQSKAELADRRFSLTGAYKVDEGLIDFSRSDAPSLGEDVKVSGRGEDAAAPTGPASRTELALNLKVNLGERLRLRGRGIDTGLRGELTLTSPQNKLAVNGTVRTEGGTYAAYGQSLQIRRGVVAFSGAVENPRLDILAVRPDLDIQVGVAVTGTAQAPRVRLYSDSDLSDADKLSWLILGRGTDGLGSNDAAILQQAALGLLAGEGGDAGPIDTLTKSLGLNQLSLRQDDTGSTRETIVSLGKQLSRRWYVGYERGLNATAGSWQLIYRIAQRFTLRAQSGLDNSLDLIWTWRWK